MLYDFTLKIPEVQQETYWKRLQILQMYSQERRMERYRVIYVWKILEGYAPNCGVEVSLCVCIFPTNITDIFNRPGVAGAVLQTAS